MTARRRRRIPSPAETFGALFERAALAAIHPDGKDWADSQPRRSPAAILRRYRAASPSTDEALSAFLAETFSPARPPIEPMSTAGLDVPTAIEALWPALTRTALAPPRHSSLLALPCDYLAPGGRFNETYYWDSYFALLGMTSTGPARQAAENFAHLIRAYGHIPNGSRTYYLSRSQPPVFFLVAALTEPADPAAAYARYRPELIAEHRWWMRGSRRAREGAPAHRVVRLPGGARLNRYWDDRDTPRDESFRHDAQLARESPQPERELWRNLRAGAESGWDFSSRWLADRRDLGRIRTGDIVPIDLNSFLHGLETAIAEGSERLGDDVGVRLYRRKADNRRRAIVRHLWNRGTGLFDDFGWAAGRLRGAITAAAVCPLFFRIADDRQATSTAAVFERDLLARGGLLTTNLVTGQQWDAPNGWAPLQWLAVGGFEAYGRHALAREIAMRWCGMVADVHARTGRFLEKYDVVARGEGGGGEYAVQDGFGWTNGVTARLLAFLADGGEPGIPATGDPLA